LTIRSFPKTCTYIVLKKVWTCFLKGQLQQQDPSSSFLGSSFRFQQQKGHLQHPNPNLVSTKILKPPHLDILKDNNTMHVFKYTNKIYPSAFSSDL